MLLNEENMMEYNPNKLENKYLKVYQSLSKTERLQILESLENKCCATCSNAICNNACVSDIAYFDESGSLKGSDCMYWYNQKIIAKSKVLSLKNAFDLK